MFGLNCGSADQCQSSPVSVGEMCHNISTARITGRDSASGCWGQVDTEPAQVAGGQCPPISGPWHWAGGCLHHGQCLVLLSSGLQRRRYQEDKSNIPSQDRVKHYNHISCNVNVLSILMSAWDWFVLTISLTISAAGLLGARSWWRCPVTFLTAQLWAGVWPGNMWAMTLRDMTTSDQDSAIRRCQWCHETEAVNTSDGETICNGW